MDVSVRGADDVDALVKRIRTHGDAKAIRREMHQGLNRATRPLREDMREKLADALPKRGGLSALVAGHFSANTSAKSGRYAGVTIFTRARGHDLKSLEAGRIRHPLFGNRAYWYEQNTGDKPLEGAFDDRADDVRREVLRVMSDIARKVEG